MAGFESLTLTKKGEEVQATVQAGRIKLEFTRIAVGDGVINANEHLADATALVHECMSLPIERIDLLNIRTIKIRTSLTNSTLQSGFELREIGVFCKNELGQEVLYCISNSGDKFDYIPTKGSQVIEETFHLQLEVGAALNVETTLDKSINYMTSKEFKEIGATKQEVLAKRDSSVKITRYDLDTSKDDTKIKMINLSDEVRAAIAGSAPVSPTPLPGDITNEKLADGCVTGSKMQENTVGIAQLANKPMALLSSTESVIVDFTNYVVTIVGYAYIHDGKTAYSICDYEQLIQIDYTHTLTENNQWVSILYDVTTKQVLAEKCHMISPGTNQVLIGIIHQQQKHAVFNGSSVAPIKTDKLKDGCVTTPKMMNGSVTGEKVAPKAITGSKIGDKCVSRSHLIQSPLALIMNTGGIDVDFNTSIITIQGLTYFNDGYACTLLNNSTGSIKTINFSGVASANWVCIWYDFDTNDCIPLPYTTPAPVNSSLIGLLHCTTKKATFNGAIPNKTITHEFLGEASIKGVNVEKQAIDRQHLKQNPLGLIMSAKPVKVDFDTRTITFQDTTYIHDGYSSIVAVNNVTKVIDFTNYVAGNVFCLWYDVSARDFKLEAYNVIPSYKGVLLSVIRANSKSVAMCGVELDIYPKAPVPPIETDVSWENNRLVIPEHLYMLPNITYHFHATALLYNTSYDIEDVIFEIGTPSGAVAFKHTMPLSSPFTMDYETKLVAKNRKFESSIEKSLFFHVKDPHSVTNKNPKILMIGDSTTQTNLPSTLAWWLKQYGITPSMIGTVKDERHQFEYGLIPPLTGLMGEGRGGWRLADYVDDVELTTGDKSMLTTNPFLNTERQFDFTHYMEQCGFSDVDFVIIGLGTNDLVPYSVFNTISGVTVRLESPDEVYTKSPERLKRMIQSIHAFNPNIKIGINSPLLAGHSFDFNQKAIHFAEIIHHELKGLNNVYCLPAYLSVGTMSTAGERSKSPQVVEKNTTLRGAVSTNVHPNGMGQLANTLLSASWIVNFL